MKAEKNGEARLISRIVSNGNGIQNHVGEIQRTKERLGYLARKFSPDEGSKSYGTGDFKCLGEMQDLLSDSERKYGQVPFKKERRTYNLICRALSLASGGRFQIDTL